MLFIRTCKNNPYLVGQSPFVHSLVTRRKCLMQSNICTDCSYPTDVEYFAACGPTITA